MYLLNISSNLNAKFYIGSALTRLNELGDMLVSNIYTSKDRCGSDHDYANCVVCLHSDNALDSLIQVTKELEVLLGRGSIKNKYNQIVVDIDILAQSNKKQCKKPSDYPSKSSSDNSSPQPNDSNWQFIEKRLPLPDEVLWGLQEMATELGIALPNAVKHKPKLADWQF